MLIDYFIGLFGVKISYNSWYFYLYKFCNIFMRYVDFLVVCILIFIVLNLI